jgi:tetratricopeptide (TPR) repeat protein
VSHQNDPGSGIASATITLAEALRQATAAFNEGKFSEAERLCLAIIPAKHDCFEALHLLAIVQTRFGRRSDALASYQRALAIRPDHADALNNRGILLKELKRYEEALASFDEALAIKPDDVVALTNRGGVLSLLKRYDEALASYDKAIALKPDYADAFYNRGNVLQKLKRCEEALASYEQTVVLRPHDAAALKNRANTLWGLLRLDEALASYDQALAVRPDDAATLNSRGNILQKLNRFDEALASYDKAIALKPDYADAFYGRGAVLQELQRPQEAVASYEKAIAINPGPGFGPIYRPLVLADPGDVAQMDSGAGWTKANVEQTRKVLWCLGMYGSASTWAYNVTRQIAASIYPTWPLQEHFVATVADTMRLDQPGRTHILKSHEMSDEDLVAELSARADVIIITIRDPRDAVTSSMLYHPHGHDLAKPSEAQKTFERFLSRVEKSARFCARFAGEQRSLLLRYEAGFPDDVTTLDRIAACLQRPLDAIDRTRIFASHRRAAVEALIAELPVRRTTMKDISSDDLMDPMTQWHTHHAGRTGEIGRWQHMLTEAQASEVERRLGDWMDRFFYQRHKAHLGA